uniref:Uncharacterized protein n=1 Tax=Anguilla anguilla TaxID=7936 RepID=A0A0E9UFD5_ANGAN
MLHRAFKFPLMLCLVRCMFYPPVFCRQIGCDNTSSP